MAQLIDKKQTGEFYALPIEMGIFVPSTKDASVKISDSEFESRVKQVEDYVAERFGGFSSIEDIEGGYYSSDLNEVIREEVKQVKFFGNVSDFQANIKELLNQITMWCLAWGQEAIGFEVEGDLFYVGANSKIYRDGGVAYAKGGMTLSHVDVSMAPMEERTQVGSEGNTYLGGNAFVYKKGGMLDYSRKMIESQNKEVSHHSDELKAILDKYKKMSVEPWVIAKMERATTDLSDVTHYLDGKEGKDYYSKGGYTDEEKSVISKLGLVIRTSDGQVFMGGIKPKNRLYKDENGYYLIESYGKFMGKKYPVKRHITDKLEIKVIEKFLDDDSFAKGGKIKDQYEGRTPEDIWNNLSLSQKQHFIYDHVEEISEYKGIENFPTNEIRKAYKSDWDNLDNDIKNRFSKHTREGQYAKGGLIPQTSHKDKTGKEFTFQGGKFLIVDFAEYKGAWRKGQTWRKTARHITNVIKLDDVKTDLDKSLWDKFQAGGKKLYYGQDDEFWIKYDGLPCREIYGNSAKMIDTLTYEMQNREFAKGGLIAYADGDYDNRVGVFTSMLDAKKFAKANKWRYETITFEDEKSDNIVVSKDDTFKDIDFLFSNDFAKGGGIPTKIVNKGKTYNRNTYKAIYGDFDKDGLMNSDDPNPVKKGDKNRVEQLSFPKIFDSLLDTKGKLDSTMYDAVDKLKKITPDGGKIYARTKTPYSIINKLIDSRMITPKDPKKGLTDMVGTTIVVDNTDQVFEVQKEIENGILGEIVPEGKDKNGKVILADNKYENPKGGYRAIHYIIMMDGIPVEVQLKTKRMKEINELAHPHYKAKNLNSDFMEYLTTLADKGDRGDKKAQAEFNRIMRNKKDVSEKLKMDRTYMYAHGGRVQEIYGDEMELDGIFEDFKD